MDSQSLNIIINATDRASSQLQAVQGRLKNFQGRLERFRPAFKKMAVAGTAATAAIAGGIMKAVKASGRAQEVEGRFAATFNSTEERARKMVSEFARQWGRAETDIKSMSATLGGTLRAGTNLAEKQILSMSKETLMAAEGMAAYDERIQDGSQAMDAFAKAMTGNAGTVRDWGFDITQARVKEKALEEGLIETKEELDATSRAQATHMLIMEQSQAPIEKLKNSEGDYAETKRRLKARITETSETIGKQFMPTVNTLFQRITPVIEKIGDWVKENPKLVKAITTATLALSAFVAVAGAVGLALLAISGPAIVITAVFAKVGVAIFLLIRHWDKLMAFMQPVFDFIDKHIMPMFRTLKAFIKGAVVPALQDIADILMKDLMNAWESIQKAIATVTKVVEENRDWFEAVAKVLKVTLLAAIFAVIAVIVGLVKIIAKLIGWIAKGIAWLVKIAAKFMQWQFAVQDAMKSARRAVWNFVKNAVKFFFNLGRSLGRLHTRVGNFVRGVIRFFFNLGRKIARVHSRIRKVLISGWLGIRRRISGIVRGIWNSITGTFNRVVGFVRGIRGRVAGAARGIFNSLWHNFRSAVNRIIRAWNRLSFTIGGGTISNPIPGKDDFEMPSKTFHTPNIPTLHEGGVFQASGGRREGLAMLESGERVVPRGESGDTNINVTQNIEQKHISDPEAWARAVAFELAR